MKYTFIWKIEEYLKNDRKNALNALNTIEIDILRHIYFNKRMPSIAEFKEYMRTTILEYEPTTLEEIIECAAKSTINKEQLFEKIGSYLIQILEYYGKDEAKKAAAIIFRKKRIAGILARDLKEICFKK